MEYTLERTQVVDRPLDEVFAFYADPMNLARITPRWLGFRVVAVHGEEMRRGLRIEYRVRPLAVPQRWVSEITEWDPPLGFVDEQRVGPYARWHHRHTFRPVAGGTEIADRVTYALPFGPLGRLAHVLFVRRQLTAIFDHRERVVAQTFARGARAAVAG